MFSRIFILTKSLLFVKIFHHIKQLIGRRHNMKMHFNYKDLFKAPRIALSFQRIWVNGLGLIAGYAIYVIISYVGLLVSGFSFSEIWNKSGLLPCAFVYQNVPWYGLTIYLVGVAAFLAVLLMVNTAVARLTYMVLRNELFYTWTQAYKFALKKWISVLGAMITFIFMIAFFIIGALIMGLIGRIPYVGELGTALLTIPYVLAALLLFFISIVFLVGINYVPAIIATSDEDALGGVFQSFSITYNQPVRLVTYSTILGFLYVVGGFIFAAAIKYSYLIFSTLFSVGMGEKFSKIAEHALYLVHKTFPGLDSILNQIFGDWANYIYFSQAHYAVQLPVVQDISAYIFAIFLIIFGFFVVGYAEALGNSGLAIVYTVLYKIQEDENLLEREDEELKEEEEEEEKSEETTEEAATEGGEEKTEEKKEDQSEEENKKEE